MKKICLSLIFLFTLTSSTTLGQAVNIGLRTESLTYFAKRTLRPSGVETMPPLLNGYLKASVLIYDKYEIELKGGLQLIDPFVGGEYAVLFKYNIVKNVFPLVAYLNHFNVGDLGMGHGTYGDRMDFIGIGAEGKFTKLFSLDLVFYFPIGKKNLEYEVGSFDERITTSKMGPMIKLGFIFNIIRI
jgi:hypothetical protein